MSKQKSLQGLDNGVQAFQNLVGVVQALEEDGVREGWVEDKIKALKEAERYLKTDYKLHISRDEECVSSVVGFCFTVIKHLY